MSMKKRDLTASELLQQYAAELGVNVKQVYGLTYDNLYDARRIVDEFVYMTRAKPPGMVAWDRVRSPDTGIVLVLTKE
jgi:hypothetical protein